MIDAFHELSTRETALLIWLGLLAIGAIVYGPVRRLLGPLLRILLSPKIVGVILALTAYTALLVLAFNKLGLWQLWMLKDTVFWFFGSGLLILLLHTTRATEGGDFFKKVALDGVRVIAVLEFVLNVYTFPLPIELILLPVLTFIAMLGAVADTQKQFHPVKQLINVILTFYGFGLLVYAVVNVVRGFEDFASVKRLEDFMLPVILTLLLIPFYYGFAILMLYESLFTRLDMRLQDRKLQRYANARILKACGLRLARIRHFAKDGLHAIRVSDGRAEIAESIAGFNRHST